MSPNQPDSWIVYDPLRDVCIETAHVAFDESKNRSMMGPS
jgi:hypothetical protein